MTDTISSTLAARGARYGLFAKHAEYAMCFKEICRDSTSWSKMKADQKEALDMISHKLGRILNGDPNYSDSWIDIAGYAKLVADRLDGKSEAGVAIAQS